MRQWWRRPCTEARIERRWGPALEPGGKVQTLCQLRGV